MEVQNKRAMLPTEIEAWRWRDHLREFLRDVTRLAVVGIGNELRGDDGVGSFVARVASRWLSGAQIPCLSLAGGSAPENLTGPVRRFKPTHILMVDAFDCGWRPGSILVVPESCLGGVTLSSHTLPVAVLYDYFRRAECGKGLVIGIQPACTSFGQRMSGEVRNAARVLVEELRRLIPGRALL